MHIPDRPENEKARLSSLNKYDLLDSLPEQQFDDLTQLASDICEVPIALISLLDESRQWFKSKVGIEASETPRDISVCGHAILQDDIYEVCNTTEDPKFADNPLVVDGPNIRYYASMPLAMSDGYKIGTLCVIDTKPRTLSEKQRASLRSLARQVVALIEARQSAKVIDHLNEQLNEKIRFISNITNTIPAMIAYWDRDLRCRFANNAYLMVTNLNRETLIGNHYDDVIPEHITNIGKKKALSALKGELSTFELPYQSEVLGAIIGQCTYIPDFDDHNNILGFFVMVTDITKVKKAEENQKLITSVFEQATAGIFITDANTHILSVNRGFTEMTGYSQTEIRGQTPKILSSKKQHPTFFSHMFQTLYKQGKWKGGIWNRKKNGDLFYSLMSIDIIKDEKDQITHYVATMIDQTENQKIRSDLIATSKMLKRTGEVAKVGGWEYHIKSKALVWTDQIFRIHGLPLDQTPNIDQAMHHYGPEARISLNAAMKECIDTGTPFDLELPFNTADGQHIWVRVIAELIKEKGRRVKISGSLQDITELKLQEINREQEELNLRNTLVREVHHRIKNNLQGVSGILSNFALNNPELSEPFIRADSQLQSVAVIYGLQGQTPDASIELSELSKAIKQNIEGLWQTQIELEINPSWQKANVAKNEAVPIALILNEAITNAAKHQSKKDSVFIKLSHLAAPKDKYNVTNNKAIITIQNHAASTAFPADSAMGHTMKKSGLGLMSSLMPKRGASIDWKVNDKTISVELAFSYPVITF